MPLMILVVAVITGGGNSDAISTNRPCESLVNVPNPLPPSRAPTLLSGPLLFPSALVEIVADVETL